MSFELYGKWTPLCFGALVGRNAALVGGAKTCLRGVKLGCRVRAPVGDSEPFGDRLAEDAMTQEKWWSPRGIVSGAVVWEMHETHGVLLEVSLPACFERGIVVTWLDLLSEARKSGANIERLVTRIHHIISDSVGGDWANEWLRRIRLVEAS